MPDHAGLIERLNGVGFTLATDRKYASDVAYAAASAIASLVKERDEARTRAEAAEARCARLEEALRLAQQYVHIGAVYLPSRDERERARNDFDRIEGVLATIAVADAEARARQALEEQG